MNRYITIYEDIKNKIIDGYYPIGSKLPSKRVTAETYDVSLITVEHSYELLIDEGYIQPRERSGYYVSFDMAADGPVGNMPLRPVDSPRHFNPVNMEIEPDALSFALYSKTARRVMTNYGEDIMVRSPGFGLELLRREIAGYTARYRGISTSYEQIIIGAGAEYLYGLIVQALGRDLLYAIESPSYQKIAQVYSSERVSCDLLPLGPSGIESDSLWRTRAKVLHITPYRSYPSGVTATAAKKREYLRWSAERDGIIIEDDFESEFSPSRKAEETVFGLDTTGHVIYVNTFTRTIGSYMRMAYMILPANMVELFRERIGFLSCTVPTLDQIIVSELISSGDYERHINRVRRALRRKK